MRSSEAPAVGSQLRHPRKRNRNHEYLQSAVRLDGRSALVHLSGGGSETRGRRAPTFSHHCVSLVFRRILGANTTARPKKKKEGIYLCGWPASRRGLPHKVLQAAIDAVRNFLDVEGVFPRTHCCTLHTYIRGRIARSTGPLLANRDRTRRHCETTMSVGSPLTRHYCRIRV